MQQACFIASPRTRARICQRARDESQRTCGAPSGRIRVFSGQPLGAPLMRRYQALSTAYPCRALVKRDAKPTTPGFHPRRVVRRPPRPDRVTPGARARLAAGLGPCCPAPSSGAASLSQDTDGLQLASSWTRDACSVSARRGAGISFATGVISAKLVIPAQAGIQTREAPLKLDPGFRRGDGKGFPGPRRSREIRTCA